MKKRIFGFLLSLLMVFSIIPLTNVSAAEDAGTLTVAVTADKTTVKKGDTIHFTVTIGEVSKLAYMELAFDLPEGLTYVKKDAEALKKENAAAKKTLDAAGMAEFIEGKVLFAANGCNYSSKTSLKLLEFDCKVDADVKDAVVGLNRKKSFAGYALDGKDHDYKLDISLPTILTAEITVPADSKVEVANGFEAIEKAVEKNEKMQTALKKVEKLDELFREVTKRAPAEDKKAVVVAAAEITLPATEKIPAEGLEITLQVPDVKEGDTGYFLLHLKEDGEWENIPVVAKKGALIGRFFSLSPVLIVRAEDTTEIKDTEPVTPQPTGDVNTGVLALLLMLGCAATGYAFYTYRRRVCR